MAIVVVDKYQLLRLGNSYQKEHKEIIRTDMIVDEKEVMAFNENWLDSGKLYEIKKEATVKWHNDFEAKQERRIQATKIKKSINAMALAETIATVIEPEKLIRKLK